jgi:hypothetical protein
MTAFPSGVFAMAGPALRAAVFVLFPSIAKLHYAIELAAGGNVRCRQLSWQRVVRDISRRGAK